MPRGSLRIAVGQISSESNHFVSTLCELNHFRNTGYLYEGDEIFELKGGDTEVSGVIAALERQNDVEIIPLVASRGNAFGPLSHNCYSYLKKHLIDPLRSAGHVDGVILSHHGSMAVSDEDDPEGDIASEVREIVGTDVPVVMTLDLHGNVTGRMVNSLSAIVGYNHYPHDDAFTTGTRGADLLLDAVRGKANPTTVLAKLPLLLSAFNATTEGDGPFAQLMNQAKSIEHNHEILSASLFLVGSYIDVDEIGCGCLVVSNDDRYSAQAEATALAERFWEKRYEFSVETLSVSEAIREGRKIVGGPVLLLDTADTTGGGAAGDGIGLVKGLVEAQVNEPCLAMVVDPCAAEKCVKAGEGKTITIHIGHAVDPRWGEPLKVTGKVSSVSDGRFEYRGGILGGSRVSMGPSVVFDLDSIQILIMSYPTYDWADEQYRAVGLKPEAAKFVGVKNMMNFRYGYRDIMKGFFVLDIPGPTPADMRQLPFKKIGRPIFPIDQNISNPIISLYHNQ